MIKYHRMNNTNIFDVVNEYVNYYNNYENGCWTKEKAYKRIHQIMGMDDSLCYLQYDDDKIVGFIMSYYKEFDDLKIIIEQDENEIQVERKNISQIKTVYNWEDIKEE